MTGAVIALLAWVLAAAETRGAERVERSRTRAEFEAVCRSLRGDNDFFGTAVEARLRARLEEGGVDPEARAGLVGRLAWELIRLGRHAEAIAELERIRPALDGVPAGLAPQLREQLSRIEAAAHLQLARAAGAPQGRRLPVAPLPTPGLLDHARRAAVLYAGMQEGDADDPATVWLRDLSQQLSGEPDARASEEEGSDPAAAAAGGYRRWLDVALQLGLDARDLAGGAVMDDFDGDGLLDLVSSSWEPCTPIQAFRNDGHGGFEEVSAAWGLDQQLGGLNLVQADYDNDGRLDLLVLRGAWLGRQGRIRNSLLRNELDRPGGGFRDVTAAAGLAYPAYPTQTASWADYDGDGDLDLYVGNEAEESAGMSYGRTAKPYPSQLFRNNGNGTFTDVARRAGVLNLRFAKGVGWGDYDDDGDPDLYVSNFGDNRLYRNRSGTFVDVAPELGVTAPAAGSFATWFFDADNDGDLDLLVVDYSVPYGDVLASYQGRPAGEGHPLLYRNAGGRFTDVSAAMDLTRPLLPMGANYGDVDNDGWPDLYFGTGVPDFEALMPNVMYRNLEGRRFEDVTVAGGFGYLDKGHGIAFGDVDNDGDQDLFQQLGGAYPYDVAANALLINPQTEKRWIVLRLRGVRANRFGVGARIEVRVGEGPVVRSVHVVAGSGGSFGASSLQQEIGLGSADRIESVVIEWPGSHSRQEFREVAPDRYYLAVEGEEELEPLAVRPFRVGPAEPGRAAIPE